MARRWSAVLARLGTPTGDGRVLSPGGITSRNLPLPLSWQQQSSEGHGGSVVVGRIETMEFGQDMVTATGSLLDSIPAEVEELIRAGVIGPSVDLDDLDYVMDDSERVIITAARVAGATLVSIPAFADVSLTLDPVPAEPEAEPETEGYDDYMLASAAPTLPPLEWFANPQLTSPTPLTVTDEGRVFGHIAQWDSCHVGLPGCVTPPMSTSSYAYFLTGEQPTADGTTVPVGALTVGGGHADPKLGFRGASEHYDNVGAVVARVFAGEDNHGIWVSGWLLPSADPDKVETFKIAPVSGDWRRVGGNLELIAVCAVNSPGFPVLRRVSFSMERGGQQSLVGQFNIKREGADVAGGEPEPQHERAADDVSRETSRDQAGAARAQWAKTTWRMRGR